MVFFMVNFHQSEGEISLTGNNAMWRMSCLSSFSTGQLQLNHGGSQNAYGRLVSTAGSVRQQYIEMGTWCWVWKYGILKYILFEKCPTCYPNLRDLKHMLMVSCRDEHVRSSKLVMWSLVSKHFIFRFELPFMCALVIVCFIDYQGEITFFLEYF